MKLISKSHIIQAILDLPNAENGYSSTYDKQTIIDTINELPTISRQTRYSDYEYSFAKIDGEWLYKEGEIKCFICSNCLTPSIELTNFCSHCGAYMRGNKNDVD